MHVKVGSQPLADRVPVPVINLAFVTRSILGSYLESCVYIGQWAGGLHLLIRFAGEANFLRGFVPRGL